jgi:hypothetical protein
VVCWPWTSRRIPVPARRARRRGGEGRRGDKIQDLLAQEEVSFWLEMRRAWRPWRKSSELGAEFWHGEKARRHRHAGSCPPWRWEKTRSTTRLFASVQPLGTGRPCRLTRRRNSRRLSRSGGFSQNDEDTDGSCRRVVRALRAGAKWMATLGWPSSVTPVRELLL